jgi:hypothetical protein
MAVADDDGPDTGGRKLRARAAKLAARYPAYTFRVVGGWDGRNRLEAVRRTGPGPEGVFVLVSSDPAELEGELRRAALAC